MAVVVVGGLVLSGQITYFNMISPKKIIYLNTKTRIFVFKRNKVLNEKKRKATKHKKPKRERGDQGSEEG